MSQRTARALIVLAPLWLSLGCGPTAEPLEAPPIVKDTDDIADRPRKKSEFAETPPKPATKIPSVKLAEAGVDFAFDAERGSLLALDRGKGVIREYSRDFLDGKEKTPPEPIKVGERPLTLLLKKAGGRRFAVMTLEDNTVAIADLSATPPAVKTIALQRHFPNNAVVASSDPDDPYVYYAGAKPLPPDNQQPNEPGRVGPERTTTGRIDVRSGKREDLLDAQLYSLMAMSDDGQIIYAGNGAYSVPDLVAPLGDRRLRQFATFSQSASVAIPDVLGQTVTINDGSRREGTMYNARMTQAIGQLPFLPLTYFRDRPIVVGLRDGNLRFCSTNDAAEVAKVPFPESLLDPQILPGPGAVMSRPRGFADDLGARVILASGKDVYLVSLPKTIEETHREPILGIGIKDRPLTFVGRPLSLKLKVRTPGTSIALVSGPPGLTLTGELLSWTPTETQVGRHDAVIALSYKGRTRKESIEVEAVRPHVPLSFAANLLAVDRSGRWAAAGESSLRSDTKNRIAVVDLENLKVVAETALPDSFNCIAIDETHVYVNVQINPMVVALDRKDLKPSGRVFTPIAIQALWPIAGDRIVATSLGPNQPYIDIGSNDALTYTRPGLKPIAALTKKSGIKFNNSLTVTAGPPFTLLTDGLAFQNGVVIDANATPPVTRLLVQPTGFFYIQDRSAQGGGPKPTISPVPWGRLLSTGSNIAALDGRIIQPAPAPPFDKNHSGSYPQPTSVVLDDPISVQIESFGFSSRIAKRLIVRDLVLGRVVTTIPIHDRLYTLEPNAPMLTPMDSAVVMQGRRVFVADAFGITLASIDESSLKDIVRPLEFIQAQSSLVADPKGMTTLTYKLRGGTPPYRLSPDDLLNSFTVDEEKLTIKVDGPKLLEEATAHLKGAFENYLRSMPTADYDAILKFQAQKFETLVGRRPDGIPILSPILLKATDDEGQTAILHHAIFIEIPATTLEKIRKSQ